LRLKQDNGVSVRSKTFSAEEDFERIPLLRRVNVNAVADFINSGDGWRRVDRKLLKDCIDYILEITNEPMNVVEIIDALLDEKISLGKFNNEDELDSLLRESKLQFVQFQDARYWPVRLPYEERSYLGYRDECDVRAHYIKIFSTDQPVRRKKGDSAVSLPQPKPATPWLRIRNKVRALEFAVRKMGVRWDNLQPERIQVPLPGPEGQDVLEKWLFIPSRSVLSVVKRYLTLEGNCVKADEILGQMVSGNIALQSFEQRRLLHSNLYHLRLRGKLMHVPRQGYRLTGKMMVATEVEGNLAAFPVGRQSAPR
jgi:hypothetical protein